MSPIAFQVQCHWWWCLRLAFQPVSDWACFILKPAENGCPWLFSMWVTGLALFSSLLKMVVWLTLALQEVSDWACFVLKPAENSCPWLFSQWVTWLVLFSSLLKMGVFGSPEGEWLSLLCFQAYWKWLSLALQHVSDWACFVFKLAENGCPWLSRMWVTGLALFSSLLKMAVLGSLACEWLGLLCFQACWKWLSLALRMWVAELALLSSWKWLSLALQDVSDWVCFIFKPAANIFSCVSSW